MRIAFIGKGGSGKSSVSWMMANTIADKKGYVCAIDADHNMDLTSHFNFDFTDQTNTFHRLHDDFRLEVGQKEDKAWSNIVLDGRILPQFTVGQEADTYSERVKHTINDTTDLMIVGLGADDVLYSQRCAHGHSASLKYYLSLVDARNSYIVIDGVAGADMLHAGVYVAVDFLSIIVEPQPNSIRVAKQLRSIAQELKIPFCIIVNKAAENKFLDEINQEFVDSIVGYIPVDTSIIHGDFSGITADTKKVLEDILESFEERFSYSDTLPRLQKFEQSRLENK
ncbi:MAG: AAA family ATPase [Candidatus Pacebacteria bacterium]|nr:AAA family ATPase [Candidatus Paceibacterota bacterium]